MTHLRHTPVLLLSGCGFVSSVIPSPCERLVLEACDVCSLGDQTEDIYCECIENGEIANARDYFPNKGAAEATCANIKNEVDGRYLDDELQKECSASLALLKQHGDDACDYAFAYGASPGNVFSYDTAASWSYEDEGEDDYYDYDYDATFSVTYTGYSIDAQVTNGHPDGYYLGLAETGAGDAGWYGEDALTGDILHGLYSELSLGCADSPAAIVASSTTLHCINYDVWYNTTYAFFGNENGDDWSSVSFCGGDDCSYYE